MENWRQHPLVFWAFLLPGGIWLVLFFLTPLSLIWAFSFGERTGVVDIAVTGTLANYIEAFDPLYLKIFWKSFWIAAVATLVALIIGFPVALAISFAPPAVKPILLLLVILPFWTNLLIRTYAMIAVLRTRGYVNFGLEGIWDGASAVSESIGIGALPRFQPLVLLYNDAAVIIGIVYVYLPFMVLPLYATLERLDRSYLEASLDLGAGQIRTMANIVIPLGQAGHHLRHHPGLHPLARHVPDPGSARRSRQPDDRQCHRASVQGREQLATSAQPCPSSSSI